MTLLNIELTKKRILDKRDPKWTPDDMADEFLETKNEGIIDIGNELIDEIRTFTRKDLDDFIESNKTN